MEVTSRSRAASQFPTVLVEARSNTPVKGPPLRQKGIDGIKIVAERESDRGAGQTGRPVDNHDGRVQVSWSAISVSSEKLNHVS